MSKSPEKTCRRKKAYNTVQGAAAHAVADCMNFKRLMSVYQCDVCQKYHLTSRYFDTNTGKYAWPERAAP